MARPKNVDEIEEGAVELSVPEIEFDYPEVDETLFPPYKTITTAFPQQQLPSMLPTHDRNVAEIMKAGQYRVVNVWIDVSKVGEQVVYTYWTTLAREW